MNPTLKLNEAFISIQGEGKTTGTRSLFLRTSGCNMNCKGCDTSHNTINYEYDSSTIYEIVKDFNVNNIIFTGGEPMLQQRDISSIIDMLFEDSRIYNYEIETNGTIKSKYNLYKKIDMWNISPKMSPMIEEVWKIDYKLLYYVNSMHDYIVKIPFVVSEENTLTLSFIINNYGRNIRNKIWLMPYCRDVDEYFKEAQSVWHFCIENNYNFSSRLQLFHEKFGSDSKIDIKDRGVKIEREI